MAIDVETGLLDWFFDLETGATCRTQPGDAITHFDPYHSEAELGLPPGFRSRPGCDFPFTRNGCGNVWSSAAVDVERGALFTASSNCDTDTNPSTGEPPPPMPPFDEAIFSLDFDGNVRWRWRLREVDNDDFAYGAVPNLFTIDVDGAPVDVVGIGNKDGRYTVIDRDGVNQQSGVAWDDLDPSALPYWSTRVVPGGAFGGVLATASVDEGRARVYFTTAPGNNQIEVLNHQSSHGASARLDTGEIAGTRLAAGEASFGRTSSVPGVMIVGSTLSATLRAFETLNDDGVQRLSTRRSRRRSASGDAIESRRRSDQTAP